jgi:hypothetical protein
MLYVVADYAQSALPLQQDALEKTVEKLLNEHGAAIVDDKSDARTLCAGGDTLRIQSNPSIASSRT